MINHDEDWLYAAWFEGINEGRYTRDVKNLAKQYHEHMTRWRPMDEAPDDGERIEVLCSNTKGQKSSNIEVYFNEAGFDGDADQHWLDIGWRPAPIGELPNAEIISGESES